MSDDLNPWQRYKNNLGNSRPWHALEEENYIDKKISEERYSTCLSCPELISLTKQCRMCGCFMPIKTKIYNASCPLGKWGEVEKKNNE